MQIVSQRLDCLSEQEIVAIIDYAKAILERIGLRIENADMCRHLAGHGASWDGQQQVRFPRRLIDGYLAAHARPASPPQDRQPKELDYSGGVGGYPMRWVDPADGQVKAQTLASTIALTRLADALSNITSIGTVGVPFDVPAPLRPFYIRLVNWRHAAKTSNSYVVWDSRLCPHILEFCQAAAEEEALPLARFLRATNYLISPLRYPKEEAEQFMWFWRHGQRLTIGNLLTIGGTAPAVVAGAVGLGLAETIAINFIGHAFHGDESLHLTTTFAPLDMRSGYMPYGRPEQVLAELAISQIARHLGADDAGSAGRQTGAKGPDVEAGLNKGLIAGIELTLLGKLSFSFGKFSTDEVIDPRLMVIENEFVDSLRRLARGFEVTPETLPLEVVAEAAGGGQFIDQEHTVRHFRQEIWMPRLFSGLSYEAWASSGRTDILEKARRTALEILASHHPRGIAPPTQQRLMGLIRRFADELGVGAKDLPDV